MAARKTEIQRRLEEVYGNNGNGNGKGDGNGGFKKRREMWPSDYDLGEDLAKRREEKYQDTYEETLREERERQEEYRKGSG